jgi:O-antigen ligase
VVARVNELFSPLAAVRPALAGSVAVVLVLLVTANAPTWHWLSRCATTRLLFAYAAWLAITVPFALWPGIAFATVGHVLPVVAMYMAIVICRPSWQNLDRLQLGVVIALAAFAAGSLLRGQEVVSGRLRPLGDTYDPNDMAAAMAVGVMLASGSVNRTRGVPRLIAAAAALLLVIAIMKSGSRGGVLALGVGGVVFVIGQRGGRRLIYLGALVFGGLGAWQMASPVSRERLATLLSLQSDYNVSEKTGRLAVWRRGATYVADHPILGVGAGNFEVAEGAWLELNGERGKWSAPHNAYLQAFADLGIVGGVLFLSLIGVTASRAARLWRPPTSANTASIHRPELLAALLAFCVAALFLSLAYSGMLVALVGLTALASGAAAGEMRGVRPVGVGAHPAWIPGQAI